MLRALVLDDNPIDRKRLRRLCTKAGLHLDFSEAGSLAEMRARMDDDAFDIVFIDYHLGMETGLDALRMLLAHEDQSQAIPIMVTSFARHDIAVEAMREGCADYLIKEELGVGALRKSLSSAFERRILLTALGEAKVMQGNLRKAMLRFRNSCGPEMRGIIGHVLKSTRDLRKRAADDPDMLSSLTALERGCGDLTVLFDDLMTVAEDLEKSGTARLEAPRWPQ